MNYQADVHRFFVGNCSRHRPETHALDLVAEVGEISEALLEVTQYGAVEALVTDGLCSEIGDAFFSLIALADSVDVDLEAALRASLKKYETLIRETGHCGSGEPATGAETVGGLTRGQWTGSEL